MKRWWSRLLLSECEDCGAIVLRSKVGAHSMHHARIQAYSEAIQELFNRSGVGFDHVTKNVTGFRDLEL